MFVQEVFKHPNQQIFLAVKVVINATLAETGGFDKVIHPAGCNAFFQQHFNGGIQYFLSALVRIHT